MDYSYIKRFATAEFGNAITRMTNYSLPFQRYFTKKKAEKRTLNLNARTLTIACCRMQGKEELSSKF